MYVFRTVRPLLTVFDEHDNDSENESRGNIIIAQKMLKNLHHITPSPGADP
jgi:hypothetical protein